MRGPRMPLASSHAPTRSPRLLPCHTPLPSHLAPSLVTRSSLHTSLSPLSHARGASSRLTHARDARCRVDSPDSQGWLLQLIRPILQVRMPRMHMPSACRMHMHMPRHAHAVRSCGCTMPRMRICYPYARYAAWRMAHAHATCRMQGHAHMPSVPASGAGEAGEDLP